MYEDPCPHGYIPSSCAECRASRSEVPDDAGSAVLLDRFMSQHRGRPKAELVARRSECVTRSAQLREYDRLSQAQRTECDELAAEMCTLDELVMEADVHARAETISRGLALIADPANREGPDGGSHALAGGRPAAPALVKGLGDRRRVRGRDHPAVREPVGGPQRPAGRAHVLRPGGAAIRGDLPCPYGAGGAGAAADPGRVPRSWRRRWPRRSRWPGVTVKRSKQEQARGRRALAGAVSNPHYAEAFRSVLRFPGEFMGAGRDRVRDAHR